MNRSWSLLLFLAAGGWLASRADGAPAVAAADTELPPCVVAAEPANQAKDVDFTLQEIKITFDRPMQTERSWSWIMHTRLGVYPGYQGAAEPRWENGGKTCVLQVKLSPNTVYAVGANSFRHTGFQDANGKVAVPFAWVFKTRETKAD